MLLKKNFETQVRGKQTTLISLRNHSGMQVDITNYGARIVSIIVPDKHGNRVDVNWGAENIQAYLQPKANYYGAVIGRVSSRIRDAKFNIGEEEFQLKPNNGNTFLHGGENGFHSQVFEVRNVQESVVELEYLSPDGEEGFPGNLRLNIKYEVTADNGLEISYQASSDRITPFNVTNHAYFNLNGCGEILGQKLQVFSNKYLAVKEDVLPTGEIASTENSPFDFSELKEIGADIGADNEQLHYGSGYDHTFILKEKFDSRMLHAAKAEGDETGIVLDVYTDQPGVHLYTGNFMEGTFPLKSGKSDDFRTAFCLETQHFSDALNQPDFPSILLHPEEIFESKTLFRFSIAE